VRFSIDAPTASMKSLEFRLVVIVQRPLSNRLCSLVRFSLCCRINLVPRTAIDGLAAIPGAKDQKHTVIRNAAHFVQEDKGSEAADITGSIIQLSRKNPQTLRFMGRDCPGSADTTGPHGDCVDSSFYSDIEK